MIKKSTDIFIMELGNQAMELDQSQNQQRQLIQSNPQDMLHSQKRTESEVVANYGEIGSSQKQNKDKVDNQQMGNSSVLLQKHADKQDKVEEKEENRILASRDSQMKIQVTQSPIKQEPTNPQNQDPHNQTTKTSKIYEQQNELEVDKQSDHNQESQQMQNNDQQNNSQSVNKQEDKDQDNQENQHESQTEKTDIEKNQEPGNNEDYESVGEIFDPNEVQDQEEENVEEKDMDQKKESSNLFASLLQKSKQNQQQADFLWGQEEGIERENWRKQSFYNYINSQLTNSQIFPSEEKKVEPIHKSIVVKANDDVDIWKDLRHSMAQKSLISSKIQQTKKKSPNILKKNSKTKVEVSNEKLRPLRIRKKSIEKQENAVNNNINQMIQQKVKIWKKQQREIQQRKAQRLIQEQEKQKEQQIQEKQEKNRQKMEDRERRMKIVEERAEKRGLRKSRQLLDPAPQFKQSQEKTKQKSEKKKEKSKQKKQENIKSNKKSQKINQNLKFQKISKAQKVQKVEKIEKMGDKLEDREKLMRRKQFEDRLKDIQVNINPNKKKQILIDIDKRQNSLKYQILSKKGLTDQEIYQNHKQFKIVQNPKKIGIQYLQNLREKSRLDDLRSYMSQQSIANMKREKSWKFPEQEESPLMKLLQQKKLEYPKSQGEQKRGMKQKTNSLPALRRR